MENKDKDPNKSAGAVEQENESTNDISTLKEYLRRGNYDIDPHALIADCAEFDDVELVKEDSDSIEFNLTLRVGNAFYVNQMRIWK